MLIYHCYVCRAPQYCALWGQVIAGGAERGVHTKQVSVFMGTNEFYEIISDADMQVSYLHTRHEETHQECIYVHPTGIPSEHRQGRHPHWLWVSVANPGTKQSAKSNSSSHFYCLKRNIINSTTQQK